MSKRAGSSAPDSEIVASSGHWIPLQTGLESCSIDGDLENFDQQTLREGRRLSAILSSLTAFLAAGARPRTPLAKAILLVLVIKVIGIAGMKIFMFPHSGQPVVDAAAIVRVIGPSMSLP